MNGPTKMYQMKPIINHNFAVELPKCMYKMRNIHNQRIIAAGTDHVSSPDKKLDIFDQNCQEVPGMAKLEAKQNDILKQLAELKKQIYSLKSELHLENHSAKQVPASIQCSRPIRCENNLPENIVVNANPSSPPYSLEIVQRLLQNQIGLLVTSHLHSSVVSLPEPTIRLKDALENFKPKHGVPVINIKIIWKNVNLHNAEFILSYTPIGAEVNLLRLLSRLTNSSLNYDSDKSSVETDSILDQCYLLVRASTKSERANMLRVFSKSLGDAQWLVGKSKAGIADVALYSAIKQCSETKLNVNLGKWYERCEALIS